MAPANKAKKAGEAQVSPPTHTEKEEEMTIKAQEEEEPEEVWELKRVLVAGQADAHHCRMEGCAKEAVVVWHGADPDDEWPMCEDCQESEFGGWPEGVQREGGDTGNEDAVDASAAKNLADNDDTKATPSKKSDTPAAKEVVESNPVDKGPGTSNEEEANDEEEEEEEEEEVWDLKKIMSVAEVTHECPIKCSHETCPLPAGVAWISNKDPTTKWYSCLDHQAADFGGWPEINELPLKTMTKEHLDVLATKCSVQADIEMPIFPKTASLNSDNMTVVSNTITPGPNAQVAPDGAGTKLSSVTPSPALALKEANAKKAAKSKPPASKKQLDMHRQWQATAESMGGPDARIIVSKPEAKKLIFDVLHDAFSPMNITELHKALKGVVPSPVLKACLNDMAMDKLKDDESMFADDTDDEEDDATKKKKKDKEVPKASATPSDPYAKSLSFKAAKSVNAALYYVDHNKLKNNGDGLEPDARNELLAEHSKTSLELTTLQANIKLMTTQSVTLNSEPTNEQATAQLESDEAEMEVLKAKLEDARGLKANEKYKLQLKRRIENMASFWRKRKRLTMDFLINMEECTDGAISAKKCLAGDGQIDVESDETAMKNATAYYHNLKKRPVMKRVTCSKKAKTSEPQGLQPAENFVAVVLDSIGCVERVFVNEESN